MGKKIIDVPISADGLEITYTALTSTGDRTQFSTVIYNPDELEDAHERPMVELTSCMRQNKSTPSWSRATKPRWTRLLSMLTDLPS